MPVPKQTQNQPVGKPEQPSAKGARRPWKKKTHLETLTELADKLRSEIAEVEADLKAKRLELERFEQAKKLFEVG